ncbi:putative MFS family arabinose efflux permease [Paenibacillus polymyxa]|uniref:MFS transporter n=1 Tax=Paenibacillus polymyxa TaxID=1406 RepID=UPI00278E8501|nr:MFS transporter [Paenibacillus polymyxa]MDQ0048235.1 putative MFS family arabinose efflux permease [Paenibacillus polymyxa]
MRLNKSFPTYAIALGVFGITNTEFGIVGILPRITTNFQISASQAGMLVSMFALIIAISGPFMTLLFSGINRKKILAGVLVVFTISNLFSAFAPSYNALMMFRLLPAFLHPVYFSVAFAAAASSVSKEQSAIAVAKVFNGLTIGMVLGVPVTSFIGDQFSLEAAFLFSSVINAIALLGILFFIPSLPVEGKLTFGKQLNVLAKPQLWLNVAAACFILASLYSVYSYFAEYLEVVTGMSGKIVSIMLILFGASGIIGNMQTAKYLSRNMVKTIIFYPLVLGSIYFLIYYIGSYYIPMIIIIIIWGAVFTGGLIVSQTWLTSEASEAPEFANSLFVSFANLGVTIGTTLGGWFLSQMGTHLITWSGVLFLLLASICIGLKIKFFDML